MKFYFCELRVCLSASDLREFCIRTVSKVRFWVLTAVLLMVFYAMSIGR